MNPATREHRERATHAGRATYALDVWLLNAVAFWLGEILVLPILRDLEPVWVLLVALASYLAIATVGALLVAASIASVGWRPAARPSVLDAWLAFLPMAGLLLPRLLHVWRTEAPSALLGSGVLMVVGGVLTFTWRRALETSRKWFHGAYACGALGVWLIVLQWTSTAGRVSVADAGILAGWPLGTALAGVLLLLGVPMALLDEARVRSHVALRVVVSGVILARLAMSFASTPTVPAEDSRLAGARPPRTGPAVPVIVMVMDTTRSDHLSVYGYSRNTSPRLEAFAEDAVVFDNAIAPSPWTLPSHASLFTGLFPLRHGAERPGWLTNGATSESARPGMPLDESRLTLAELLRTHGYRTGAVVANFAYLDPVFGLDQGFEFYDASPNVPVKSRVLWLVHKHLARLPWVARFWRDYRSAEQINRVAVEWLASRRTDSVFLFLNYMEPHRHWTAPGLRYVEFASEPEDPEARFRPNALKPGLRETCDLYDSQIASLDDAMGTFFDALRRLDLYDRAMIVVTADHGESLGEHAVVGHGKSLHGAELSIPLLIKYPSARQKGRVNVPVQLVDVLPTIATELGLPVPEAIDGGPIGRANHPILAEFYADPRDTPVADRGYAAALYEGDFKVIVRSDGRSEVFDLRRDPSESQRVHDSSSAWAARRREWVTDRYRALDGILRSSAAPPEKIDPRIERALEALGYLGDDSDRDAE